MEKKQKWILIGNEKFYYDEEELFHGRKIMDPEISRENLQIFVSVIEAANISYGIFFGTLLGAVREKGFIPHDEDIDIYTLDEDREKTLGLLYKFKEAGLQLVREEPDMISLMRNNEYIDLYFFKVKYKLGIRKMRVFTNEYEYAAWNLENPVKQDFLGINISMPNNPSKVVRKIYGKNWKIPLAHSHSAPNTIYKRISNMASVFKNLPFYTPMEVAAKKALKKLGF